MSTVAETTPATDAARIVIVGAGLHGGRIGRLLADRGESVVGAVDPARAGERVRDVLAHEDAADAAVLADVADLANGIADLAIVTATVDLATLADVATTLFARGLDVVTIHSDAFDPPADWAARIDAAAKKHGRSFLATGVQDHWWVHMPAVAAGSMSSIERIELTHHVDLDTLSVGAGLTFGVGETLERFERVRETLLLEAPVMGAPMRVLARRLGLTPGEPVRSLEPLVAVAAMPWPTGGTTVEQGTMIGFEEVVTLSTAEGIDLHGILRTALQTVSEQPFDRVRLVGDPTLVLEHSPFPGDRITDVVPVNRIHDVRSAAAGFYTVADLGPATFRRPARPTRTPA